MFQRTDTLFSKFLNSNLYTALTLIFSFSIVAGLTLSPALISIGVGGIALLGLLKIQKNKLWNPLFISWIAFYVVLLIGFFQETHLDDFQEEIRIKLPFLLVPLGWIAVQKLSSKQRTWVELTFLAAVMVSAVATLTNYSLHYKEINELVAQSQEVPIKPKMSHIYFSMLAAWAVILSFYHFRKNSDKIIRWIALGICCFLFCCVHIFAARTGLIALYAAIGLILLVWMFREKLWKWAILGLISLGITPVIAYYTSTSFNKRIWNSQEDIRIWKTGGDISWRSVSMRLATWQIGWQIFRENPLLGVGNGDAKYVLQEKYIQNQVNMKPECYLHDFHNQWIETGVGLGLVGILFLVNIIFWGYRGKKFSYRKLAFWSVVLVAMLTESVLERQVGVSFITLFSFWEQLSD